MPCSIILWKNAAKASLSDAPASAMLVTGPFAKKTVAMPHTELIVTGVSALRESVFEADYEPRRRYPQAFS